MGRRLKRRKNREVLLRGFLQGMRRRTVPRTRLRCLACHDRFCVEGEDPSQFDDLLWQKKAEGGGNGKS